MKRPVPRRFAALLLLFFCAGCRRQFYRASGEVTSKGGGLGTWHSTPEGCTRDPFDGQPLGESASIATLLWEDPSVHDPQRDTHRPTAPDAPMRLEVGRGPRGLAVSLATVKTSGTLLDLRNCSELEIETHEQPTALPQGRPALAGRLRFRCEARDSSLSADLSFERCEY